MSMGDLRGPYQRQAPNPGDRAFYSRGCAVYKVSIGAVGTSSTPTSADPKLAA